MNVEKVPIYKGHLVALPAETYGRDIYGVVSKVRDDDVVVWVSRKETITIARSKLRPAVRSDGEASWEIEK